MANRLGCWTPQLTPIVDAIAIFCFHSLVQCLWVCGRFVRSRLLNAASTLIPIHPEQISQSSLSEIMVSFCQEIVALLTLHFVMSVIRLPAPRPFPLSRYMVGSCFFDPGSRWSKHEPPESLHLPPNRAVPSTLSAWTALQSKRCSRRRFATWVFAVQGHILRWNASFWSTKMGPKLSPKKESKEGCAPRQTSLYRFFECQRVLARVLCSQSHFPAKQWPFTFWKPLKM